MPILSGPPPIVESPSCRQCGRDFNALWRRSTACGHCGYEYCSSCMSDGQALMPRRGNRPPPGPLQELRDAFRGGPSQEPLTTGYDVESVCVPCLGMLQVTAAPVDILRSMPLKRLKDYLKAYDIAAIGVKEKEDLVQAVYKARRPTMTLPPENESYYRRRSVPLQGQMPGRQRAASSNYPSNGSANARTAPRPAPPRPAPPPQQRPPPPNNYRPSSSMPGGGQWSQGFRDSARPPPPPPGRPNTTRPPPPRGAQPARTPPPRPPPAARPAPPVPSILSLVALPNSYVASLSIGTLKAILYENHVRVDFKQVLEKEELIKRVNELVEEERKRLERQRVAEEREAREAAGLASSPPAKEGVDHEHGEAEAHEGSTTPEAPAPPPTGPVADIDRGLCVVCQDEEATLAVVDCGHLAMCQHCSDLVMATSKECPLCRTRIVTPQRLIRIYRV
ncbi:hypothetical protein Q8F55_002132 [Vanrija albida]|uniref:RING-type domain-containing protein n=1 Tax=Vanrija albida TaxID=181172 RepID=A0ABR3Q9S4_9TREE